MQRCWFVVRCPALVVVGAAAAAAVVVRRLAGAVTRVRFGIVNAREGRRTDDRPWRRTANTKVNPNLVEDRMRATIDNHTSINIDALVDHFPLQFKSRRSVLRHRIELRNSGMGMKRMQAVNIETAGSNRLATNSNPSRKGLFQPG